ncbi:hypothetical protein SEA_SAMISTI12_158 [Streptomyces phage Samisti12]|uniref:DUF7336 domain-containing protein n=4 Tax=Samistivirus TaxID=2560220 RepID=A0A223G044_9CAUD|nr:hypothetical protein FDI39_gp128 [Streptomyces phage Samisti12]ASR76563.1 hypothetical protein SEA_SUSHI23_156 [Streptomyces phage Sushi23]QGH78324.1 hypothetical protein SEA_TRIBUTE_156 [Streptomyces phage Tribute]QRI46126.1 hypothetical protein SEA_CROSS_157 [Streptomyces phage Cross]WNN95495.1 hypothetical protein SEA_WATERMOORE_156 [Streptomyces phage Watermoore]AST15366.1 hypothetical protein SEA_SAMISTI12_158 [Streptomyces phage Samisti12]
MIYIVTDGVCCCGIEILGVFTTKEKAQKFVDSDEKYKYAEIEEHEAE